MNKKYIISACLLGEKCKYNGGDNFNKKVQAIFDKGDAIAICPESLAELPIPRPKAEIIGGEGKDVLCAKAKVLNEKSVDISAEFINGAKKTLAIVKKYNVKEAILKARSPSCGSGEIYDGSFSSKTKKGDGVTVALLKEYGIKIISEEQIDENV